MIIKRKSFENTFHFYFSAGFRRLICKERRWVLLSFPPPLLFFIASLIPFKSCNFFWTLEPERSTLRTWYLDFFGWRLTHERRLKFLLHMLCNERIYPIIIPDWLQFPSLQWRLGEIPSSSTVDISSAKMWHKCDDNFSIRVVAKLLRKVISEIVASIKMKATRSSCL